MTCSQCQHENPADAKFCNACGAKLDASCVQCGRVNPPGSRFCNECGTSLVRQSNVQSREAQTGTRPDLRPQPLDPRPITYTPAQML